MLYLAIQPAKGCKSVQYNQYISISISMPNFTKFLIIYAACGRRLVLL